MDFDRLLSLVVEKGASDLFITAGVPPSIKLNGKMVPVTATPLAPEKARELVLAVMNEKQRNEFLERKELNFAISARGIGRFRASAFYQRNLAGMVLRRIETNIPRVDDLGLPEAELLFEELTDPPGIRFWPDYKGRDGCRTPIPWEAGKPPNGFTTGKPWLPIKPELSALNVAGQERDTESLLNFYRAFIAWRHETDALVDGDVAFLRLPEPLLGFRRTGENGSVLCLFILSSQARGLKVSGANGGLEPVSYEASLDGRTLALGPNGYGFLAEPAGAKPIRVTASQA
jgi:glycosidase